MNDNKQFGILDLLALISFALQLENQKGIVGIQDIQGEVDRAIDLLNEHLQKQDEKLNKIMEALNIEDN